jgi:kinesin family protein 6/9
MFDLLAGDAYKTQSGSSIQIQDDNKGEVHVKGLSLNLCANEEDALNQLFEGETMRTVGSHSLNKDSSRSHCIYTIHIESKQRLESSEKVIRSKLHLVDLAGNERAKKTGASGNALKEAAYINKALSFLEQCVVSTVDKQKDHVPYRQCKLTSLLKNAIGGNCKTIMIANVWPEQAHLEETISTLKFATRMMRV